MNHTDTRIVSSLLRDGPAPSVGPATTRLLYGRPPSLPPGPGRVAGTVQKTGSPNSPVARRVRLTLNDALDNAAPAALETWSDPITGEYEFIGLALGVAFAVCSFDHTGEHNAVIAAPIYAEPMP